MKLSIRLIHSRNEIIAHCPELDINCYADTRDEAIRRIRDVIYFYIDSAKELGLNVETLSEIKIEGETDIPMAGITIPPHPPQIH